MRGGTGSAALFRTREEIEKQQLQLREARALRKVRHPGRSEQLRRFLED